MKPKAVRATAATLTNSTNCSQFASGGDSWNVRASGRKTRACTSAIAAPPQIFPSTIAQRRTGATSTDCRKPSLRSSITEIVVKMAVNSTISITLPGNEYSRKPGASELPSENDELNPAANSSQNSTG